MDPLTLGWVYHAFPFNIFLLPILQGLFSPKFTFFVFRPVRIQGANKCMPAKFLQSCPTLYYPVDCCLPGSSVHGIFQARILKWVIMPSS